MMRVLELPSPLWGGVGGGGWGMWHSKRATARRPTPTLPQPKPRIRGFRPPNKAIEIGNSRFRLGGGRRKPPPASCRPLRPHQSDEAVEQVVAVAGARRGLGMVLHREHRRPFQRDAAIRSVEQRYVGLLHVIRQARAVDREAV